MNQFKRNEKKNTHRNAGVSDKNSICNTDDKDNHGRRDETKTKE